MAKSGGEVQPVAQGLRRRTIQPLGAMRKARPTAMAECGLAISGVSRRSNRRDVDDASSARASASDSAEAAKPTRRVRARVAASPGSANRRRHASRPKLSPPSAGR